MSVPEVINTGYELVAVGELTEHPRNVRHGDVETIKASIVANGFFGTLEVQRSTRHICAGNHRFRAAKELGLSHVPVVWLDVDDTEALRILLVDNRANDLATYDEAALGAMLSELAAMGELDGTGYDQTNLDDLLAKCGPPPDIDALHKELGEPDDSDFWPVLRFKVSPATRDRFVALVGELTDDEAAQFEYLLDATEAWRETSTVSA